MTDNLRGLIERLEKLEGPDREVEAEIDVALFGGETVWKTANYTMESYPASRRPSATHIGGFANEHVPSYTASLDAAVALVERVLRPLHPCMTVNLRGFFDTASHPGWWRAEITWPSYERVGHAPAPAIALLIAALKALQENPSSLPNKEDRNG